MGTFHLNCPRYKYFGIPGEQRSNKLTTYIFNTIHTHTEQNVRFLVTKKRTIWYAYTHRVNVQQMLSVELGQLGELYNLLILWPFHKPVWTSFVHYRSCCKRVHSIHWSVQSHDFTPRRRMAGSGSEVDECQCSTHPEIDSWFGIEIGIESTLYHTYWYKHLRRKNVSISNLRSRFNTDFKLETIRNSAISIQCYIVQCWNDTGSLAITLYVYTSRVLKISTTW